MSLAQVTESSERWYPANARVETVASLFAAQAARTPDATALIAGQCRLTFRELDNRSDLLAAHLQELGIGPEKLVGIAMDRSELLIVSLLAVLKAGGAYVPLDPKYPAERLAWIIEDSKVSLLLTTAETTLPNMQVGVPSLAVENAPQLAALNKWHRSAIQSSNAAYVIYTSGSTGRPKGVVIEHRNLINLFNGMDIVLGTAAGVWLAVTSICFDISVLELFWTLTRGFTVVLHETNDISAVAPLIPNWNVTHLQMTPTLARMLVCEPSSLESLGCLSHILLGGEPVPASLVSKLRERFRGELFNMYGPTETTVWSTTYRVQDVGTTVPIGRPILNTDIQVLDPGQNPVPFGELGELYIGGEGVARGYLNRPDLTGDKFVRLPSLSNARFYRTGDLVRFLPDGNIEFSGRVDYQIKLRGHRIEPGEIEATLEQSPAVRQAIVMLRESASGDRRLVAYIIPSASSPDALIESVIRGDLEARLPDYMVPSNFVFLDSFPSTANRKIDRKALLDLPISRETRPIAPGIPNDPRAILQSQVAAIWRDALGVALVGLHQNLFDLGAHSLTVAEVHLALKDQLRIDISIIDLFQFSTVASLCAHISGVPDVSGTSETRAQFRRSSRQSQRQLQ